MYSGQKQRMADWAGIDAGGPRPQVPMAAGYRKRLP
jgi:hypothetical protein